MKIKKKLKAKKLVISIVGKNKTYFNLVWNDGNVETINSEETANLIIKLGIPYELDKTRMCQRTVCPFNCDCGLCPDIT